MLPNITIEVHFVYKVIYALSSLQNKPRHVYITGYGLQEEWPEKPMPSVLQLLPGERYTLWPLQG